MKAIVRVQTSRNVDITWISNGHISVFLDDRVTGLGMLIVLQVLCMLIWTWPDPRSRSRSLTFWNSANCNFSRLSPLLFCRATQNWWLTTTVWHLVYSYSKPDFCISPPVGGHMTSEFAKCWHHQNSRPFISALTKLVIVNPCRPQQAVHAGRAFWYKENMTYLVARVMLLCEWVSWSLTSLFITNTAISETKCCCVCLSVTDSVCHCLWHMIWLKFLKLPITCMI